MQQKNSEEFNIQKKMKDDYIIALAGNPNVGKSTVFNALTGLKQHTGNWAGKTVDLAQGSHQFMEKKFILVDLPGTYSLIAHSAEEEIARDFICDGTADAVIVVCDATCLERSLILVLQVMQITSNVIVCVNLMDEAAKKKIRIDLHELQNILSVSVVGTSARAKKGLPELLLRTGEQVELGRKKNSCTSIEAELCSLSCPKCQSCPYRAEDTEETQALDFADRASEIAKKIIHYEEKKYREHQIKIDRILTGKYTGLLIMLLLLSLIFWLTITGANYPSKLLADGLFWFQKRLTVFFTWINAPEWLHGALVLGVYRVLAWVISVMLPPMAIFFPLFTLLEDLGYLPRVAFNLDHHFKKACACGKQCLTMCMGKKRMRNKKNFGFGIIRI